MPGAKRQSGILMFKFFFLAHGENLAKGKLKGQWAGLRYRPVETIEKTRPDFGGGGNCSQLLNA